MDPEGSEPIGTGSALMSCLVGLDCPPPSQKKTQDNKKDLESAAKQQGAHWGQSSKRFDATRPTEKVP